MSHLVPCLSCHRHVLVAEDRCPFCGVERSPELRAGSPPALPKRRLGRAALFTFGATLVGAACGDVTTGTDSGTDGMTSDAGSDKATGQAGASGQGGQGGKAGSGGPGGGGGSAAPAYGVPAPFDGGGVAPLYGLPATTDDVSKK